MESLPLGQPVTMLQNVAYAVPVKLSYLTCTAAGPPTFQACNEPTFAAPIAISIYEGYVFLTGLFVRCTSGNVLTVTKAY
jgi:hypothetical protein